MVRTVQTFIIRPCCFTHSHCVHHDKTPPSDLWRSTDPRRIPAKFHIDTASTDFSLLFILLLALFKKSDLINAGISVLTVHGNTD